MKGEDGEPVQVCQNPSFILPGRALSNPVRNALAVTPFNGIDNMAQLVAAIVSTENGFTTIDPIGESILQSSLVSAGLNN